MTEQPARQWPKTGTAGAHITKDVGDHTTTGDPAPHIPARPYPGEPFGSRVRLGDLNPELDVLGMRTLADDLNALGGTDATFVAGLVHQIADDRVADARTRLGLPPAEQQLVISTPFAGEPSVAEKAILRAAADEAVAKTAPYGPWEEHGVTGPLPVPAALRLRPWWRRTLAHLRRWRTR